MNDVCSRDDDEDMKEAYLEFTIFIKVNMIQVSVILWRRYVEFTGVLREEQAFPNGSLMWSFSR